MIVALLLLPDVSRISFAGIVEIERTVKEQSRKTDELLQRITMISQQQVNFHQNFYSYMEEGEPRRIGASQLDVKAEQAGFLR